MSFARATRVLERGIAWIGVFIGWATLVPLIGVSVYDMVGRQFFNTGSTRLQELQWHFFMALVMLCLGYVYLRDGHVRIDILRDHMRPRMRAWIELVGCLVVLVPFCLMLIVFGGELAHGAFVTGERSRAPLGLPMRWIIVSSLPLGGLLLLVAGLCIVWRNALLLAGRATGTAADSAMTSG